MKYQLWDLEVVARLAEYDDLETARTESMYMADETGSVVGVLADLGNVLDWNPVYIAKPIFHVVNGMLRRIGPKPRNLAEGWELTMRKWYFIKNHPDIISHDGSCWTCGLCVLFIDDWCVGCPIREAGKDFCGNTPYSDFCYALDNKDVEGIRIAAEREFAFLEELRQNESN